MSDKHISENAQGKTTKASPKKVVRITDDVQVKVKSNYYGTLFFKNKRTGDSVTWKNPGEIQIVTMGDLKAMKAEQSAFFRNQWVFILGVADHEDCNATFEDICKALVIEQHYQNYIEPTNYREICGWSEKEIAERVAMLTPGARENLIVALNTYIKEGVLDSLRKIKAFEEALGCKLYNPEE